MAIVERREIEFDAEAIVLVIAVCLRAAQGFGLLAQRPIGVRLYPRDGSVEILYGTRQAPQAIRLAAEPLGALLVSYCIRARIPLPRKADKGIRVEANSVILAFKTDYVEVPVPEMEDNTTRPAVPPKAWTWVDPGRVV